MRIQKITQGQQRLLNFRVNELWRTIITTFDPPLALLVAMHIALSTIGCMDQ